MQIKPGLPFARGVGLSFLRCAFVDLLAHFLPCPDLTLPYHLPHIEHIQLLLHEGRGLRMHRLLATVLRGGCGR